MENAAVLPSIKKTSWRRGFPSTAPLGWDLPLPCRDGVRRILALTAGGSEGPGVRLVHPTPHSGGNHRSFVPFLARESMPGEGLALKYEVEQAGSRESKY